MADFCPVRWPEIPTPENEMSCQDCGLYQQGSRMVWGEGNPNASIMIILDNPGAREDKEGNPIICGTRQTLQKAAHEVGLQMTDLYVTYILKRRPVRKYEKEQTREICMQHLEQQILSAKPTFIFCMGNVAVQSFFKTANAEVKNLRGKWHKIQDYETAVAYHPLAVRRRPNLWPSFLMDWEMVYEQYKQLRS
ncbi:uracil-DNA glycosylase [Bacillus sp. FJAT-49711]|uniref:uracil-DNA glycosylase n=1 Tax=Bacillus sp. FJAT-49711 TaxID=2833585 RepID=UPI001BCA3EEE|nr:uracil-DNA glycosylase [Bacillus sp. FJAT-49711]MBS4220636.1 uracil-DNA glycosylase [Bacillus sp. FJAT-49711]